MNEELNLTTTEEIQNLIYTIRGKQVMLDSDVASLYHYETKFINLTVKRNIERFPEEFCFQLTEIELENLRLQFATSSLEKPKNSLSSETLAAETGTGQSMYMINQYNEVNIMGTSNLLQAISLLGKENKVTRLY